MSYEDYSKTVACQFVKHLQTGNIPWRRSEITETNFNPVSGHKFSGMSQLVLEMKGMEKDYDDPRWLTAPQARKMGAYVKENEPATKLEFWTKTSREPVMDANGKKQVRDDNNKLMFVEKKLDRAKPFYIDVFNASQIEGLEKYQAPKRDKLPLEKAEEIIQGFGATITEGRNPSYNKDRDVITLPPKGTYKTQEEYYASVLYELGTATGHPERMARPQHTRGSKEHSSEELRNELASYFTSKDTGMRYNPVKNTAHIKNWMETIEKNPREIFEAARDAMQIKEYLLVPKSREQLNKLGQSQERVRSNPEKYKSKEPKLAPTKEFASLLAQMSLTTDKIIPDGKWHNTPEGAYRVHLDDKPNGYVINKEHDMAIKWSPQGKEITGADITRLQAETQARKEQMAEVQAEGYERAGKKAYASLKDKPVAEVGQHPYLKDNPKSSIKIDEKKGLLFVPINDKWGKAKSFQVIDKDGKEMFMKGGEVNGGMLRLGARDLFKDKPVVITPSFKDAQSIREKTGSPTIVAFTNGNMKSAVEAIRGQYPDKELILAMDKDDQSKAKTLAESVGAKLVAPDKVKAALKPAKGKEVDLA